LKNVNFFCNKDFIVEAEFLIAYHKRHKSMILLLESLKFMRDEQQRKAVCLEKEWNIRDNYANATQEEAVCSWN